MSEKKFIAGWLLIPAAITWFAPVIFGMAVYQEYFKLKEVWPMAFSRLHMFLAAYPIVWLALLFSGSLAVVYLLVRHSRLYPKLSTLLALLLVGSLLAVAFINAVFFNDLLDREDFLIMLGLFTASLCWWAYMRNSGRVRATFSAA